MRIFSLLLLLAIAGCCTCDEHAHKQKPVVKSPNDTSTIAVFWLLINPEKISDLQQRQSIAASIDRSIFADANRNYQYKGILLESLVPPVYDQYKSVSFIPDTNIRQDLFKKQTEKLNLLLQNGGARDNAFQAIPTFLYFKLGIHVVEESIPFADRLERILKGDYCMTILAATDEENDPLNYLKQLTDMHIVDTTRSFYQNENLKFSSSHDKKNRLKILAGIENYLLKNYIVVPLFYEIKHKPLIKS